MIAVALSRQRQRNANFPYKFMSYCYFAPTIDQLLIGHALTRNRFATVTGVSRSSLYRYLATGAPIPQATAERITEAWATATHTSVQTAYDELFVSTPAPMQRRSLVLADDIIARLWEQGITAEELTAAAGVGKGTLARRHQGRILAGATAGKLVRALVTQWRLSPEQAQQLLFVAPVTTDGQSEPPELH